MTARRLGPVLALALLAILAVLAFGAHGVRPRVYSLGAPNQYTLPVATGRTSCEGPVSAAAPVAAIGIWGAREGRAGDLTVTARTDPHGQVLARGQVAADSGETERDVALRPELSAHRAVYVCVSAHGAPFALAGGGAVVPNVQMTGAAPGQEFALLLLGRSEPLLSQLGRGFDHASLFKLSWMGGWTLWLLLAGLIVAFPLAVVAVLRAASTPDPASFDREGGDGFRAAGAGGPDPSLTAERAGPGPHRE